MKKKNPLKNRIDKYLLFIGIPLGLVVLSFYILALMNLTFRDNFPMNYYILQLITHSKPSKISIFLEICKKRDEHLDSVYHSYREIARKLDSKRSDPEWLTITAQYKQYEFFYNKAQKLYREFSQTNVKDF